MYRNSLTNKNRAIIEITSIYIKIDRASLIKREENVCIMRINCNTNEYKDISINGTKDSTSKWKDTNGDKLINDVISDSCENVF